MLRNGKSAVTKTATKSLEGRKRSGELKFSLVDIHQKEKGLTFSRVEMKTMAMFKPGLKSNQAYLAVSAASDTEEKGNQTATA